MRQRIGVSTLGIIGGLLVLLMVAAAACDDPQPTATSEPTKTLTLTSTHTSTSTLVPIPTDTPALTPTGTPMPTSSLTPAPTNTPAIDPTATPTPERNPTPTVMPTATPPPGAAAAAIDALPWVQDDMTTLERSIVGDLQTLAARAPEVFWELMHKPWMEEMREDIHGTELQEIVVQLFSLALHHRQAHTYWSFFPPWLREGAVDFMTTVSADAEFSSNKCSLADNLSDLDRLYLEHIESGLSKDIIYRSGCSYFLGRGLFLDLYEALGEEAFRQGFGRLYLTMRGKEHDGECTGLERGVCYVRAAFVTDALPESAALAEPVIVRWYYGSPPHQRLPTPTPEPTATSTPGSHAAIDAMPWLADGITATWL